MLPDRSPLLLAFALYGVVGWAVAIAAFLFLGKALPSIGLPSLAVVVVQCVLLLGYGLLSAVVLWRRAPEPKAEAAHALVRTYAALSVLLCIFLLWIAVLWDIYSNP
jgi:hypothetical protein